LGKSSPNTSSVRSTPYAGDSDITFLKHPDYRKGLLFIVHADFVALFFVIDCDFQDVIALAFKIP